jgi:hypothetical protein
MTRWLLSGAVAMSIAATLSASGKLAEGPAVAGVLTMRIPNESAPAGGMVQMKVLTTEVTPISGGRPALAYDSAFFGAVAGFAISAPNGEIAGAAIIDGAHVQVVYDGTSVLSANYPVMTIVLAIRPDAIPGTRTQFNLDPSSTFRFANKPTTPVIAPATVTVGGSISITDVIPGEGVWPARSPVSWACSRI